MENQKFDKNDLVWAKIRGYPWWPAIINQIIQSKHDNIYDYNKQRYLVKFVNEDSYGNIKKNEILQFYQHYNRLSKNKDRKLQKALNIVKTTNRDFQQKLKKFGNIDFIINKKVKLNVQSNKSDSLNKLDKDSSQTKFNPKTSLEQSKYFIKINEFFKKIEKDINNYFIGFKNKKKKFINKTNFQQSQILDIFDQFNKLQNQLDQNDIELFMKTQNQIKIFQEKIESFQQNNNLRSYKNYTENQFKEFENIKKKLKIIDSSEELQYNIDQQEQHNQNNQININRQQRQKISKSKSQSNDKSLQKTNDIEKLQYFQNEIEQKQKSFNIENPLIQSIDEFNQQKRSKVNKSVNKISKILQEKFSTDKKSFNIQKSKCINLEADDLNYSKKNQNDSDCFILNE